MILVIKYIKALASLSNLNRHSFYFKSMVNKVLLRVIVCKEERLTKLSKESKPMIFPILKRLIKSFTSNLQSFARIIGVA